MKNAIRAGGVYFAIVFACAFAIGTVRVLLVAPRTGATVAVMLEAPLVLAISWLAFRWCVRRWATSSRASDRMVMGATGFGLLLAAEAGVGSIIFHRSLHDQITALGTLPGAIGLAAQIGFALIPLAGLLVDGARRRP